MLATVPTGSAAQTYDAGARSVPYQDTRQTVGEMLSMAKQGQVDVPLREFLEEIVRQVRPKDYLSEMAAVYYWACTKLRYMRDPRLVELVRGPARILRRARQGGFDCDDLTTFLVTAALLLGMPLRILTVGFRPRSVTIRRSFTHVLPQVQEHRTGYWATIDHVAGPRSAAMLSRVRQARIYEVI